MHATTAFCNTQWKQGRKREENGELIKKGRKEGNKNEGKKKERKKGKKKERKEGRK